MRSASVRRAVGTAALLAGAAGWAAAASPPPLTTAAAVAKAAPGADVDVQATVLYAAEDWGTLFVGDATGVVFVDPLSLGSLPAFGTRLQVQGRTATLRGSPGVVAVHVALQGSAVVPQPAEVRAPSPPEHLRWAAVEGVVRSVVREPARTVLLVRARDGLVRAEVRAPRRGLAVPSLVDSRVRLTGVLESRPGTGTLPQLWVQDWTGLRVITLPVPLDEVPLHTVAAALATPPPEHRVRVRVRTVARDSLRSFVVSDRTGQIRADIDRPEIVAQGALLELWGFVEHGVTGATLRDVTSRHLSGAATVPVRRDAGLPTLTTVAQIRALPRAQAERGQPVSLEAVVTFADVTDTNFFVQDDTGGIYVRTSESLLPGTLVHVDGVTAPGNFAPIVAQPRMTALRRVVPLPAAPRLALLSERDDCRLVEAECIVRSLVETPERTGLELDCGGQRVTGELPRAGGQLDARLVDAVVRIRAVCGTTSNWRGQLSGVILHVPSAEGVTVLRPAPAALPLLPIADALRAGEGVLPGHRVRISAVALHQTPDRMLFVRDETATLAATLSETVPVAPGERVELVGFPVAGRYQLELENAVARLEKRLPAPAPRRADVGEVLGGTLEGELVSVRARLAARVPVDTGLRLLMQSGPLVFEAVLEAELPVPSDAEPGSLLELVGICHLGDQPERAALPQLLLRGPGDVRVVERPAWWNPRRAAWTLAALLGVLAAAAAWGATLRRQVRARTSELQERMKREEQFERDYTEQLENMVSARTFELEQAQAKLIAEERLAALGKLTATVSHELRNPLATIRGSLFLVDEALAGASPVARRALERAERNVDRCNRIIEELLEYARSRPLERSAVVLDDWLAEVVSEISVPPGIALGRDFASKLTLEVDVQRLQRCIINLVGNAAEARGAAPPADAAIGVSSRCREGRAEILVRDNGPGIPADIQAQVFEPFFSTKSFGVGLGLAIVRQIMEKHGGGVHLESRPGDTTFTLWLPLRAGAAAPSSGGEP